MLMRPQAIYLLTACRTFTLFSFVLVGCLELPEPVSRPQDLGVPAIEEQQDSMVARSDMTSELDVLEPQSDILSTDTSLSDAVPVDVAMPLPVCGDGIVDPGEECDDGMATPSCSAICQEIVCGNGRVDPGESCDDGSASPDCSAACEPIECGNVFWILARSVTTGCKRRPAAASALRLNVAMGESIQARYVMMVILSLVTIVLIIVRFISQTVGPPCLLPRTLICRAFCSARVAIGTH